MVSIEKEMSNLIAILLKKYYKGELTLTDAEIADINSNEYVEVHRDYENRINTYKVKEFL